MSGSVILMTLAGCTMGSGGGDTGSIGPGQDGPIKVNQAGDVIENGGAYCTPLNVCGEDNAVSMFSEQRSLVTITNASDAPLQIDSVTLELHGDAQEEEWTLIDTELSPSSLAVDGTVLEPGGIIDFYPRFFPVQSGERSCTITITYDGGSTHSFDFVGYGSYESYFYSTGIADSHHVLSAPDGDELSGGMALTRDGSMVFTANSNEVLDSFSEDILVAKVDASGELAWAKIWNGPHEDLQPDSGQNGETGGTADSIDIGDDGSIYVAGRFSPASYNSQFYSLLLKIDPDDGSIEWEKAWSPNGKVSVASDSSMFYAVDVDGDYAYAVGTTSGEAEVSLVVFKTADGSVKSATAFDIAEGYNDRGYSVRADGQGGVYIGGYSDGGAMLMHVVDAQKNAPSLDWAILPGIGKGGVNSIDVDSAGDVYVSYDVRGASTNFLFGKVTSDGSVDWTKEYVANNGDKNNTHVIRVVDRDVFVGGRTGPDLLDGQMGDGLVVVADAGSGDEIWASEYFNGKGPDEMTEHRVKGVGVHDGQVVTLSQAYTGTANYERYWGYWYYASGSLEDAGVSAPSTSPEVTNLSKGTAEDASPFRSQWVDAPAEVEYTDAEDAVGTAPDGASMIMRITE